MDSIKTCEDILRKTFHNRNMRAKKRRLAELISERDQVLGMLLEEMKIGENINIPANVYLINSKVYEFNIELLRESINE